MMECVLAGTPLANLVLCWSWRSEQSEREVRLENEESGKDEEERGYVGDICTCRLYDGVSGSIPQHRKAK